MTRRLGKLADFKGGELLARLKAGLSQAQKSTGSPKEQPVKDCTTGAGSTAKRKPTKPHLTPDAERAQRKLKKAKTKSAKANGHIVIKARSAEERAAYKQALASSSPPKPAQAACQTSGPKVDFGEGAFRRLAPLRAELEGFAANHRGPSDIPPDDRAVVLRRVKIGAERVATIVDEVNGYFLGYDFGTSTTKVVARNPYALGGIDEAFAIPVPSSVASDAQAHLFPTTVYWNRTTGHFSLLPGDDYSLLDSFKSALVQGSGHRICNGSGVTMAEAATAFVAIHLAYCIGAGVEEVSAFGVNAVNAGIPVAVFDGQSNIAQFDRVFRAATTLVGQAPTLSLESVQAALKADTPAALPIERYAELAGAIAGYCSATRHYLGGHMIIDCGSATLDIVTFDLNQQTHRPIGIYGACVENLGADACALFIKKGSAVEECRAAVRYEEHLVYKQTIKLKPNLFCHAEHGYPYQIILIGGGVQGEIHADVLKKLSQAFEKEFHQPEIAPLLRYDKSCAAARLILADGLARDPVELRDIVLPKPPPPPKWSDPVAPGKEQV